MIVRKIPVGCYVKITPSNVDKTQEILYDGWGEMQQDFVRRIEETVTYRRFVYVRRDAVDRYSFGGTTDGLMPYKTLGELE